MRRLLAKLASKYDRLHCCYEAGPTGYGLHRLITELGHTCEIASKRDPGRGTLAIDNVGELIIGLGSRVARNLPGRVLPFAIKINALDGVGGGVKVE